MRLDVATEAPPRPEAMTEAPVARRRSGQSTASASAGASRSSRRRSSDRASHVALELLEYQRDVWERGILFWDVLRRRADNMLEHERAGLPPLLDFKSETLLDARKFDRPVNYALLRIAEIGDLCADHCVDPSKAPVIVVDPRAGHGPGIGGFKRDSEVGMALREGHTVYFVIFFPEPAPGQTLADVLHALRRFVEAVAARHPGKPPVLYGNCQAGWAAALLSADCQGLVGPAILNGSPLSYWSGEAGINPLRLLGGLLGGAWLARYLADLGGGRFDGAWLVQNFEHLKPESALWTKYANLFADVDGERERFLEFERWWNGFYALSVEEITAIVENLFVGNRLEEGRLRICHGCHVDLRRIRNPLVVFSSYGDDITPPHQALGWLGAVYESTTDLKRAGQRIVYLTNPRAGHLGLFVSADVARFEHRAILESLSDIEALKPGLYEMKIEKPTGDRDCHKPRYAVRFEERDLSDVHFPSRRRPYERARTVSEFNAAVYRAFVSPWVRAGVTPWSAAAAKWLHPMRTSRYLASTAFCPWMGMVQTLTAAVSASRQPLDHDHPLLQRERLWLEAVGKALARTRKVRDAAYEQAFASLYGV